MRSSGVLMHITSLPGPYGIGTMGQQAYRFVDFVQKAGQGFWQVLPLSPTGFGDSPYQSCSAFAGNHYLIDLDMLIAEGLLLQEEVNAVIWQTDDEWVDFGLQYQNRLAVLRLAWQRFSNQEKLDSFCLENSSWLPDFALYMALKDANSGKPWYQWEESLKRRDPDAIWNARQRLKDSIRFYCFVQYLFYQQWHDLLSYAHSKGIRVIGDVPIYLPLDSVEVWTDPELFQLDENLTPTAVAGCPPDAFSEDGQLWGNPLYRWDVMKKDGFDWWLRRLSAAGRLYDVVRLDHFRGFEAYWSVPYGDTTARNGKWIKGPGIELFQCVQEHLPQMQLIAEDLGFLTQEVLDLRDQTGLPGMKVLEFAFDSQEPSDYLPHNYIQNTVCYIGTHDNMTANQWLETAEEKTKNYAIAYMSLTRQEGYVWGMIRTALSSVSKLCILQMQDLLELGGDARMNFPGITGGNWIWRAKPDCFRDDLAKKLQGLTKLYGRMADNK